MTIDRDAIFERDGGVCALCGLDTDALAQALAERGDAGVAEGLGIAAVLEGSTRDDWDMDALGTVLERYRGLSWGHGQWLLFATEVREALGFKRIGALWEADHIHPQHYNGPDDPGNLRTLCVPCHQDVTAGQATARAKLNRVSAKHQGRDGQTRTGRLRPRQVFLPTDPDKRLRKLADELVTAARDAGVAAFVAYGGNHLFAVRCEALSDGLLRLMESTVASEQPRREAN